jgi:hypothetical protein
MSLDWFKGKSTGNHGFYHEIWGFPVNFPIIQFYEHGGFRKKYGYPQIIPNWWFQPAEKHNIFSWDDYSQYVEKMFQTTNQ